MTLLDAAYRRLARPLLFRLDAEDAHNLALGGLERLATLARRSRSLFCVDDEQLATEVAGLRFPNPVGLAAGCDKNGSAVDSWPHLGFGFVEIGTVTGRAQPGNPRPRVHRFPAQGAIVNRLGFNNDGAEAVAARLAATGRHACGRAGLGTGTRPAPLGINIGKSKGVEQRDDVIADYLASFSLLYPFASYFTVNVSSPNTPGLREWQEKSRLSELLAALQGRNREMAGRAVGGPIGLGSAENGTASYNSVNKSLAGPAAATPSSRSATVSGLADGRLPADGDRKPESPASNARPVFLKVDPDLPRAALDDVVEVAIQTGLAGIIATNTTVDRGELPEAASLPGGLSGRPLFTRSTDTLGYLYRRTGGKLPLIGVGGVFSAEDAYQKLLAGASLVQVYTGFVFEGPGLIRRINEGLLERMQREGVRCVGELVGKGAALPRNRGSEEPQA